MESILHEKEKYRVDDSIKSYEYNEYHPTSGSNLNMAGQITINIDNQDEWYHHRRSVLLVEGDLIKRMVTVDDDDVVSLANNGVMYLFTNVKYVLDDHKIESVNHPGFASTVAWYAKISCWLCKRIGLMDAGIQILQLQLRLVTTTVSPCVTNS